MSRIRVEIVKDGLHPSEAVVAIDTTSGGKEYLTVSRRSVDSDSIEVGFPVAQENGSYLVELPRETEAGSWRVWVSRDLLFDKGPMT